MSHNVDRHHYWNERAWDRLARVGHPFARAIDDLQLNTALRQIRQDPWLEGSLAGRHVLCLAAGGGRHGVLYAAAGAVVTVVDVSAEQLSLDRQAAAARRLDVRTVQTSMDYLPMLNAGQFDLVVQPVSTCYIARLQPLFAAVARVLRHGGLYISQHKQPVSLQANVSPSEQGYEVRQPYHCQEVAPPEADGGMLREPGTREYLHRWEDLLGGMCRAGMVIEDLYEPHHGRPDAPRGSFAHRAFYIPPYVRVKARRRQPRSSGVSN